MDNERTEMMLSGDKIEYVLIGLDGVRVYRKGGGIIDAKPKVGEYQRAYMDTDFIGKDNATSE
jgi:hypothetical protein